MRYTVLVEKGIDLFLVFGRKGKGTILAENGGARKKHPIPITPPFRDAGGRDAPFSVVLLGRGENRLNDLEA